MLENSFSDLGSLFPLNYFREQLYVLLDAINSGTVHTTVNGFLEQSLHMLPGLQQFEPGESRPGLAASFGGSALGSRLRRWAAERLAGT